MNPRGRLEAPGDRGGEISSEEQGPVVVVVVFHNGRDGGSFGSGSVIVRPLHYVTVTRVQNFVYCIFMI